MVTTPLKHMKEVGPPGYVCRICGLGPYGYLDALQHWQDTGHWCRRALTAETRSGSPREVRADGQTVPRCSTQSAPRYSEGTQQ
jgi:hypothetical protein